MAYEVKDGDGTLFPEREKRNPKGPDWTGQVQLGGITYRIAGWERQRSGGAGTWLSLRVEPQRERTAVPRDEDDGDIPF